MNKVMNYVICLLSVILIVLGGIIVFRLITFEKHTIYFNLNGLPSMQENKITCNLSIRGCIIELPKLKRFDGVVLGYSDNKDDTKAKYQMGDKVLIHNDIHLYPISYKNVVLTIDKNNVDYLEKNEASCKAYNQNTSCKIKLPNFNVNGYQLIGYSENKKIDDILLNSQSKKSSITLDLYYQNEEYEFNHNMTLYPSYTKYRKPNHEKLYNTKDTYQVNNSFVEFENSCSQDIVNTYKGIIDDINKNAPYLFVGTKINILSTATFYNMWGGGGSILGVNYHVLANDFPLSRSLDILSSFSTDRMEKYYVVVHEMGHSFDFYYGHRMNPSREKTINNYTVSGNESISNQSDIKNLYSKYKYAHGQKPLRSYSYSSINEFVAESIAYYYLKYIVPANPYKSTYYPDDLKATIEKYFCIAKNNYNASSC